MKLLLPRTAPRSLSLRAHALHQRRAFSSPRTNGDFVRIIEVGPRDGLQNEKKSIPLDTKFELVRRLATTGLQTIEAGSFVSPKWVPQMASSDEIMKRLYTSPPPSPSSITYQWLLPNIRGLETFNSIYQSPDSTNDNGPALNTSSADANAMPTSKSSSASGSPTHEISIFLAATESFSKRNTNCTIAESLERFRPLISTARAASVRVRAYISVALGCPFEGPDTDPHVVASLAASLLEMGADEISVADTTGMATPPKTRTLLRTLSSAGVRSEDIALHFHDTFGQALVNVLVGLEHGVRAFDSAVGGLGGCPFSPGATGNVATEDLVYTLHALGAETGVDIDEVSRIGAWITSEVGKPNESRAGKGTLARLRKEAGSKDAAAATA
ncbi:hypothetical protein ANO11243_023970 [Dothideomycetidae sp. 11243]|nr:hypothetical protein ANO11243_023970 [fungal sp. No.11243]